MLSFLSRLLALPTALLALTVAHVAADVLEPRASTVPAPISFTPDENWDGIDGQWSSFTLRVGTPQQFVRTFVSFASYQTWVVIPQGCSSAADQGACGQTRGGIFYQNESSTFQNIGIYDLWIEDHMGYGGNAIYGYDSVGLGGVGEGGPTLRNTTVGGLAVDDFYLGIFGINPKPTNFSSFNEPSTSYMTQLKEQGYIPSVSFGYTAGAKYRFAGVYASLTLGGYDTSRYIENNVTFLFGPDNERDVLLSIQSITTPSQTASSPTGTQLLPTPVYAYIDATLPQIFLPLEACQAFEAEFGLIYDNTTELYLVNATLHEQLLSRNPNITFTLAQGLTGGPTVQITLPYAAFDLQAQPPFQGLSNSSSYFPLMRAANDSQIVLGRTFLQEAYITVDYEAQRFQLAQNSWVQNPEMNLVAIPPFNQSQPSTDWTSSTWGQSGDSTSSGGASSSSSSSSGVSGGAIAGIVIGAVAVIALLAGLIFWHHRSTQKKKAAAAAEKNEMAQDPSTRGRNPTVFAKAELEGSPSPFGMTHFDRDQKRLLGGDGSLRTGTPGSPNAPSTPGYFGRGGTAGSSTYSPSTPSGEGTHSSTQSGTLFSALSPTSEADSKQLAIYEMAGDMPAIREKDGKALTEKEALAHRERKYNGVDSSQPASPDAHPAAREPRRVNPEDVVNAETGESVIRHRAFSFEADPSERDLYS